MHIYIRGVLFTTVLCKVRFIFKNVVRIKTELESCSLCLAATTIFLLFTTIKDQTMNGAFDCIYRRMHCLQLCDCRNFILGFLLLDEVALLEQVIQIALLTTFIRN
jgi:hypothetical protein